MISVGIRNWIGRGRRPATAASYPVAAAASVERKSLTPEQLADLDAARAELLQLAAPGRGKESQRVPSGREPLGRMIPRRYGPSPRSSGRRTAKRTPGRRTTGRPDRAGRSHKSRWTSCAQWGQL
uniref:Uncharacterized protein n=1 Tax=Arthrobacter sp. Chr15 TaxID=447032 RepID=A6YFQ2_9MICC|nr:unknown [Arthrobacter sp. Chr15]